MKTLIRIVCIAAVSMAVVGSVFAQSTIYVDATATGSDTGQTWQDAFNSLQDALGAAVAGDRIWVASGVYSPHDNDRSVSFKLVDGVRMHGGFAGGESNLSERSLSSSPTILSGDLTVPDDGFSARDDNSFHVVTAIDVGENTLIEGFIIRAGHANGVDADSLGGGLLVMGGEPAIMNVQIVGNYGRCGGGAGVLGGSPEFVNVVLNGNRALRGGGLCALNADGSVTNATITANTADTGAGVFHMDASPTYANSIITGNSRPDMMDRCELMQYPCTLADMTDEVDAETRALLIEAHAALASSSLDDAEQVIATHPDVVELHRDGDALMFRLRGGTPTYLSSFVVASGNDPRGSGKHGAPPPVVRAEQGGGAHVVGEDTNLDGVVDNRDQKRALVLAPHEWDFAPYDESRIIEANLQSLPEYQGNVDFNANPGMLDNNLSLADYSSWNDYDLIYVSTHGRRICEKSEYYQATLCGVLISSGIRVSGEDQFVNIPGVRYGAAHGGSQTPASGLEDIVELELTEVFFKSVYGAGLDNAIVILSACETGGFTASELAEDMGDENFVMLGWTEPVDSDDANFASRRLMDLLSQGLTVAEGLDILDEEGLKSFDYTDSPTAEFTRYAPSGGDQRLIEIIQLVDGSGPLLDGASVEVVRRDGTDRLNLFARIMGVIPEKKDQYAIEVELDGEPIGGTYDLSEAQQQGPFSYLVELEEVDTGQLLTETLYALGAIVDLPEGGESRYSVDARTQPCSFEVDITGNYSGSFDGAASINFFSDGSMAVGFESRELIDGATGPNVFDGGVTTGPLAGPETVPGEYSVIIGSANHFNTLQNQSVVFKAGYSEGTDFDCPTCGGTVVFERVSEVSVSGSLFMVMPVYDPPERFDSNDPELVTMTASFTAVPGSLSDVDSPYVQCRGTYAED